MGYRIAVLIGIETYEDQQLSPVPQAVSDVKALGTLLRTYCKFDEVHCFCDGGEFAPTLESLSDHLKEIAVNLSSDDSLFFCVIGHMVEVDGGCYLLAKDTPADHLSKAVSISELKLWLGECKANTRAFVLDICRYAPIVGDSCQTYPMTDSLMKELRGLLTSGPALVAPAADMMVGCKPGERFETPNETVRGGIVSHLLEEIEAGSQERMDFHTLTARTINSVRLARETHIHRQSPWLMHSGPIRPLVLSGIHESDDLRALLKFAGVEKNAVESAKWYRKAAEMGSESAMVELGDRYMEGNWVARDEAEAVIWYRKAAERGNDTALFKLIRIYESGYKMKADDPDVVKWYRKWAEAGDREFFRHAMLFLAWMYRNGSGVKQDYAEAIDCYNQVAEIEEIGGYYTEALCELGQMYEHGIGVEQNDAEAFYNYLQAAEAEARDRYAMLRVGLMYQNGRGVEQDYTKAVEWYLTLIGDHNNSEAYAYADSDGYVCSTITEAMHLLGLMYQNGRGVERDSVEAVNWYRKAADQDNVDAMVSLGRMYEEGRGLERDDAEAVKYYRMAAEMGSKEGICKLGWMYQNGYGGLPMDREQALQLYNKVLAAEGVLVFV